MHTYDTYDTIMTFLLLVGAIFLAASVVLYISGAKPWKTREGVLLLSILVNFAMVEIFALLLTLNILENLSYLWWSLICFFVAINGVQIFFMIFALQKQRRMFLRKDSNNVHA